MVTRVSSERSGAARARGLWPARIACAAMFVVYGTVLGTWTARIPAVRASLHATDAGLGLALLAFAAGAMTGMQVAGRFVDRVGAARIVAWVAFADGVALLAPALARSLVALAVALYAFGVVHGCLNIAMNSTAVALERVWGSSIMTSQHAAYSLGGFLGAAAGGLAAQAGLGVLATFAIVAVAVAIGVLAALPYLGPRRVGSARQPDEPAGGSPGSAGAHVVAGGLTGTEIVVLCVLAFCCLVGEGAAADWASVYLRDDLGATAGLAAAGYAAFAVAMMAGRLVGDQLKSRFGSVAVIRGCGLLAAVGLAAGLALRGQLAAVIGFGCFGAGLSCLAPLIFSAAGQADPAQAGRAIARVATIGWLGFLVGPVVIGFVAKGVGLGVALVIPALLASVVAGGAGATRRRPRPVPA
jgi:predicted MFS family arabinose efflux permease